VQGDDRVGGASPGSNTFVVSVEIGAVAFGDKGALHQGGSSQFAPSLGDAATLRVTSDETIPGVGAVWPVLVPGVPIKAVAGCGDMDPGNPSSRYLNIKAFRDAAPFSLGNVSIVPNARRCGYLHEDLGIQKAFPIREHTRFILGANAQNLFNRHYLTSLNTDIDIPASFGRFSNTSFGRSIQLFVGSNFSFTD
jgi:hypothetical protein